jgi:hypothetical protein
VRNAANFVGQPILAAAGFQPALEDCEEARMARESRLKGGCGQNCPPHIWGRMLYWKNFAALGAFACQPVFSQI